MSRHRNHAAAPTTADNLLGVAEEIVSVPRSAQAIVLFTVVLGTIQRVADPASVEPLAAFFWPAAVFCALALLISYAAVANRCVRD